MPSRTPPRRIVQPPSWQELIDLDEATKVTGLAREQLLAALDERDVYLAGQLAIPGSRRKALRWHIPNAATRDPLQWRRGELTLWTLRLGTNPGLFHGVEVVGYTGLALLYDLEEQSIRVLVAEQEEGIPGPVFEVDDAPLTIALFDQPAMRTYGIKTMRLASDGVTATRLRPRRT